MNGSKNSDMKKRIIVIGGGAAGMQTALRRAEQGAEAVLLVKEAELGGKPVRTRAAGRAADRGRFPDARLFV